MHYETRTLKIGPAEYNQSQQNFDIHRQTYWKDAFIGKLDH